MRRIVDNISILGYTHIRSGKECQDSSLSWESNKYAAIVVCDGHGNDRYIRSAVGSEYACICVKTCIDRFMGNAFSDKKIYKSVRLNAGNCEKLLPRLEEAIISAWNVKVEADLENNPLENDERFQKLEENDKEKLLRSPEKAYGTTFICAVMTSEFCFILKLGDGNVTVIKKNAEIFVPDELSDPSLEFNLTTSMCNFDAAASFKHCFMKANDVKGIILTSDGVINSFNEEQYFHSLLLNIFNAYESDKKLDTRTELGMALSVLSEKGSGDDMSVAIVKIYD